MARSGGGVGGLYSQHQMPVLGPVLCSWSRVRIETLLPLRLSLVEGLSETQSSYMASENTNKVVFVFVF